MEKRSFRSVPARLALLALAMLGAALLSLCLGAAAVSPREILSVLSGGGKGTTAASILLYVRLPRTLGCLLAGAALAVSGAVIQTVLANPLAAPNIIGVNSGAGLGVALCCAVLPTAAAAVPFAAFLGAFAGVMLVLLISEKAGASRMTLVLAGVAISGMFGAGIDAVLTVFPDSLIGYSDFRIGGLANLSMGKVAPAAWVILLCLGAALALANEMDVLALGADTARSLGLRVRGVRVALLALAAALAGAAVSFAGLLGFVGLVAPHMVRRLVGGESRRLLAGCALGGAARGVYGPEPQCAQHRGAAHGAARAVPVPVVPAALPQKRLCGRAARDGKGGRAGAGGPSDAGAERRPAAEGVSGHGAGPGDAGRLYGRAYYFPRRAPPDGCDAHGARPCGRGKGRRAGEP